MGVFYFWPMLDYIIVGGGLAGIALAEEARERGRSFVVFNDFRTNSSRVAAGIYNPVILKRFKAVAEASSQLLAMNEFYDRVELLLARKFRFPESVLRKFHSIEEQNNWFAVADNPMLSEFIKPELSQRHFSNLDSPFGYGEVCKTGWVDTAAFIDSYHSFLADKGLLISSGFDIAAMTSNSSIEYANFQAWHIIFAEGFAIRDNPLFNYLPLDGTKGEILTIKSRDLKVDAIVNTGIFVLPVGDDVYKIGATYNWTEKDAVPTSQARSELLEKLNQVIKCKYEVIDHKAGVRPTVKDRKPLLGTHPKKNNVHILNGLGTRGVMLAPAMARMLLDNIESGLPIPREINISRFGDSPQP